MIKVISSIVLLAICAGAVQASLDIPTSPAEVRSTVTEALAHADTRVAAIIAIDDAQRTYANTVGAIDDLMVQLDSTADAAIFMAYVHPDLAIREAASEMEEASAAWYIDVGKNEDLYNAVVTYAATNPRLEGEEERYLAFSLRDYRRAGMDLPADERTRLTTIEKELSTLSIEFESNIRADETKVPMTRDELAGVPDAVIDRLPVVGDVYLVGMDYPTFGPILDYATSGVTRQKIWMSYKRRAGKKNVAVLEKIITLRAEQADLLGYQHTADFKIEIRMAKNAANVAAFYEGLRPLIRAKAKLDWAEFLAAKRADTGDATAAFYPWDFSYYREKLKKDKYAVDSQAVQQYFPMENVIEGLLGTTQTLFGIEYREIPAGPDSPRWHDDVRMFEVWDSATNLMLGKFYIDLHPRDGKYTHAAQWGLVPRKVWADGSVQTPIAALVCNFNPPGDGTPSLLTHDEVETFYHEFGHGIHTILTEAEVGRFAGTRVERDFVEAPSQMLENWVWQPKVLQGFAKHWETGETLPIEVIEGMIAAKNLGSGMLAEHQIYYGQVDQTYHTAPGGDIDTTQVGIDLYGDIELYEPIPNTHFQAGFGHLTGYEAGYYGYLWSLVFAQDMWNRFQELGILNPEAGQYYREKILSRGGTMDGLDMVTDYLGRPPSQAAFVEHLGLD
jgi:thimet oligopeptidase